MAWFDFRTRSRERDRETDLVRLQRILDVLDSQISGIEDEKAGLHNRYRRTADDAAFSLEALENGDASLSPKVDRLTNAMTRCMERLSSLEAQAAFLVGLRARIGSFMAEPRAAGAEADRMNEARHTR